MSEPNEPPAPVDGPPPAGRAATPTIDPRADLLRLAAEVTRTRSRRLLIDYLRLRRVAARA